MLRSLVLGCVTLIFSTLTYAGAEQYSSEKWLSFGSSGAIVLPFEKAKNDSKFYGLVVECIPSSGKYRISIKDMYADKGDLVRWETDKKMGSIANKGFMVIRTHSDDVKLNKQIVSAIKNGNWIEFTNTKTGNMVKYTLKNSTKALNSITTCKF